MPDKISPRYIDAKFLEIDDQKGRETEDHLKKKDKVKTTKETR